MRLAATFLAAFLAATLAPVHATSFLAPAAAAPLAVSLEAPAETKAARVDDSGRLRVGDVRALPKAAALPAWKLLGTKWITRFTVRSAQASGIRARLELAEVPGAFELRAQGADGRVERMAVDPGQGPEAWTPWTEGDTQLIEIASDVEPWEGAVRVGAVVHFTDSPFAKALSGSCTVPVNCTTNDAALDAAIARAKKSMMRLLFNEGGGSFVCTATLIDTARSPAPYVMTANHCINDNTAAQSITTFWFYENATCDASSTVTHSQVPGGMQLVFGNHNVDSTLLLMNGSPPEGAVYATVNRAEVTKGQAIVSLSHPSGDAARLALGSVTDEFRLTERPQDFKAVTFTRGIIEGGSSGSALFTLSGGQLQFRGTLLGTTLNNSTTGMSCTDPNEYALYSRFDIFAPEIDPYVGAAAIAADDAPNRPQDLFGVSAGAPLDTLAAPLARDGLRIDYAGDLDTFKFTLAAPAVVSAWSEGPGGANLDTVGALLDSAGSWIDANDDAQMGNNHFGLTHALDAGTYYVQVGHYEPAGTGAYNLRIRADQVSATNYTDLWGVSSEPGWGINLNHQGNILFASLFTYDASGAPLWLAMSNGQRQPDGSFEGALERYAGAPLDGAWHAAAAQPVGTMRIAFTSDTGATLGYTFNGVAVTKTISRFVFVQANTCKWSAFDRSWTPNFQDLWYTPSEPGSGLNIAHQKDTVFASLFTYDASGNPLWLYMSAGALVSQGRYTGTLYRTTGPAFNASPWTAASSATVGQMTLDFSDPTTGINGNKGTLTYTYNGATVTKPIQRFVFGPLKPDCSSD